MTTLTAPIAHRRDPLTSHEAAQAITDSGARQTIAADVLHRVRTHPGLCCSELALLLGRDRVQVARRLTDLLHAGAVTQGAARVGAGERREVTWWAVAEQGRLAL